MGGERQKDEVSPSLMESDVWKYRCTPKSDLPETFSERRTREFGGKSGALPSPEKNEIFGIGGDAISRCLGGLLIQVSYTLQSLLSRYSITFSVLLPPLPNYFYANLDKFRN